MGQISKCVLVGRHKELLVSADVYVSFHSVLFLDVPLRLHITTIKGKLVMSSSYGHQVMRYKDGCERGSMGGGQSLLISQLPLLTSIAHF